MRFLSKILFAAATIGVTATGGCAVDPPESSADQALVGDHGFQDQATHYGFSTLSGFQRKLGAVAKKVTDFNSLEADLTAMRAQYGAGPCTRGNGCLRIVNEFGGFSFGAADDAAARHDVTLVLAEIGKTSPQATLTLIDGSSDTGSTLQSAVTTMVSPTLALDGATIAYGIGPSDPAQAAIDSILAAHPLPVTAPAGALVTTRVVRVGATDYSGTATDVIWSGSTAAADILSVGRQIPEIADGSPAVVDSLAAPAGMILGRLANQPTSVATRAQLMAAASTHFTPVSGSASRGIFRDGSSL